MLEILSLTFALKCGICHWSQSYFNLQNGWIQNYFHEKKAVLNRSAWWFYCNMQKIGQYAKKEEWPCTDFFFFFAL